MLSTWIHDLPLWQMTLVVFGATLFVAAAIHAITRWLTAGQYRRSFTTVSPALLSPLGVIFGLLIAFTAAQVWSDLERANVAVDNEASALRSVVVLSAVFPQREQTELRSLIRDYIQYASTTEWPEMGRGAITLKISPPSLNEALQVALSAPTDTPGQQIAQRQVAASLEQALDARRQRILLSRSEVSGVKWVCLSFIGICLFFAIAVIHCESRLASAVALGLFSAGVATAMLLILAHDRPFTGDIAVQPEPLLQVMPAAR